MIRNLYRVIKAVILRIDTFFFNLLIPKKGKRCLFQHPLNLVGIECIELGDNVFIMAHTTLAAYRKYRSQEFDPLIKIGDDVTIGERAHITSINNIIIGKGTLLGKSVTITDNSHGSNNINEYEKRPSERMLCSKGPVHIGKNCWLGDKVTVCPGVTIGDGCVIGANSVVTKDMPSYSVCAGNPCRVIKKIISNEE